VQTCAIVVAAGGGTRFGAPKQFARLGRATVVERAVHTAAQACDAVVVVVPPDHRELDVAGKPTVLGGATRSDSVRAGLATVPAGTEIVVVHDAARPLASRALFDRVIAAVRAGADAAVPAVAVADTVKQVTGDRVVATLPRDDLVLVQTPQAFQAEVLRRAHASGGAHTDDAALVEAVGGTVVVVPGEPHNFKLTVAADLELAQALLDAGAGT
jgi:2-C-methyl-D-erythritol 4-phosphate cytidylyltransferase